MGNGGNCWPNSVQDLKLTILPATCLTVAVNHDVSPAFYSIKQLIQTKLNRKI